MDTNYDKKLQMHQWQSLFRVVTEYPRGCRLCNKGEK